MKNFSRTWFLYQGECICVYLLLFVVDSITAEEEVAVVGEIETWDQMMRSPDHDSTTPDRVIIFRNYDYRFFSFSCSTLPYFYYPWFRLDANPANDTVEIFDIPKDTEIAHLSEMFKTIGVIKKDRRGNELIRIHDSGEKALITFDDPFTARSPGSMGRIFTVLPSGCLSIRSHSTACQTGGGGTIEEDVEITCLGEDLMVEEAQEGTLVICDRNYLKIQNF